MSDVDHSHSHRDPNYNHYAHTHGVIDPALLATQRGIWAVKWSLIGLAATAVFQLIIVFSGSAALLADTVHNIADAGTAIPLSDRPMLEVD
jgi:Co/Zn/Cd efflux system component